MTTQQADVVAPLANALPQPPDDEVLTEDQWTTLLAIADTVIPQVVRSSSIPTKGQLALPNAEYNSTVEELKASINNPPDRSVIQKYLAESATTEKAFRRELQRFLAVHIREDARKGIALILSTLNSRVGGLVFNGSTKPFHEHNFKDRTAMVESWQHSYLPPLRAAARALTVIAKSTWTRTSPTLSPLLDYPRVPAHGRTGKGYKFDFQQFRVGNQPEVLETDVVVVGSGCGAGVVAKNLAADGHRVIVVEKGYYHPPEHMPMSELEASQHLFHGGGVVPSDDNSVTVIAGSTWGGGGTVNWSASLQTQGQVRKEWADGGLTFFTSADFQASLDRVCHRMGVSTEHIEHNHANRVLLEGARRLGYSARAVPQNTGNSKHYCGYCTLGCHSAIKQGPVVSWLPDAVNAGSGSIEGLEVREVLFDNRKGTKVAIGMRGTWTSRDEQATREVIIKAKKVVISAGSLFSPLILLRSGLKNNQIGRNLKLHPTSFVFGVWPEEIKPWEGGILTSVCEEFQNLDGKFHGAKLETVVMLPSWVMPLWPGMGLDFKKLVMKFKHMSGFFAIARDEGSGMVYPDAASGLPRVAYTPSAIDRQHLLEGLIAIAKICYVTGAKEIFTVMSDVPRFVRSDSAQSSGDSDDAGINDPHFQAWLDKIRSVGLTAEDRYGCAHQMGSCRMGTNDKNSVVNQKGQVWGTDGLYVSDASVFPSASGVNPMVTNMAISDWISRGIAKELRMESRGGMQQASL